MTMAKYIGNFAGGFVQTAGSIIEAFSDGTGDYTTIAAAVAAASAGDAIAILGSFDESVTCSLAGITFFNPTNIPKRAIWDYTTVDGTCLNMSANYITVDGIYFKPPAYSAVIPAAIKLSGANHGVIQNCRFQGKTASHNAIYSAVADSDNVKILNNQFHYMNTATSGAAILGLEAGGLSYSAWEIINNFFHSCVTAVNINGRVCEVRDNTFMEYGISAAGAVAAVCTLALDLSGTSSGGNNVTGNTMMGDYAQAGLYKPGASGDCWLGNFADDTSEAEVGTDTGITILAPT